MNKRIFVLLLALVMLVGLLTASSLAADTAEIEVQAASTKLRVNWVKGFTDYVTHYEVGEPADPLVVEASGQGPFSYQWYYYDSENGSGTGTLVEGATDASFTPDTSEETEMRFYYCAASNGTESAKSYSQPVIVGETPAVTVYFSISHDDTYIVGDGNYGGSGAAMAFREFTVPYFDLQLYGLENFYFQSESYSPNDSDNPGAGSNLDPGTSAYAYGKITALHLLIYALEHDYCGLDEADIGKGYLFDEGLMGTTVLNISGSSGSMFLQEIWDYDLNLNYYLDYEYPLASAGWGSTVDQILLHDGSIFTLAHFTDWSFYSDSATVFNHFGTEDEPVLSEVTITDDAPEVELTLYLAGASMMGDYTTDQKVRGDLDVYYTLYSDGPIYEGDVTRWTYCGTVDSDGKFTVDLAKLDLDSGRYLFAVAGQYGAEYTDAIVSAPGGIIVNVNPQLRTVTFTDGINNYADQTVDDGDRAEKPQTPTREGYRFGGWFTDAACTEAYRFKTPVRDNLSLYGSWIKTWNVAFDKNDGSTAAKKTVDDGQTVTAPSAPTREGYRFDGWYSDAACTKAYAFTSKVKADITLYAKWVKTWTVTFDNNGTITAETIDNGLTVSEPEKPVREGYRFDGWYTDDSETAYDFTATVTADVTLHAKWTRIWTVTFVNDFATADETQTVEDGQTVTKPEYPAKDGYRFIGWYTNEARTDEYDFGSKVTENVTLYAKWVKTWTVTFDNNGTTTTETIDNGLTVSEPEKPVREGYVFLGWFTDEACTVKYSFSTPVTADLTLYAGWEKDAPIIPVLPAIIGKPSLPSTGAASSFSDVSRSDWYYEGVKYVWEEGLMNGTGSRTFSPEANTTRGMILTMLARAEGVNTSGTPWYAAGQKWAMDAGISDGANMEGATTREQLAAMLYRYANRKGYDVSRSAELSGYTDAASVSTYAVDAMRWAVAEGLIQGMGGKLSPQATATRAQVATILMRFMKLYTK